MIDSNRLPPRRGGGAAPPVKSSQPPSAWSVNGKATKVAADDLRLAATIGYVYGWRMQSEILMLERRHINFDGGGGLGTMSLDP